MKIIDANTKIGYLLKAHPDALEAIISIDSKFNKLRNPILRRVLAGRTSISMASKIAGCNVSDFFNKLRPLGFEIDADALPIVEERTILPDFMKALTPSQIIDLDVRELLATEKDPLNLILGKIKSVQAGQALKVINTFEPVPLIKMLEKKDFAVYVDTIDANLVETYFYKKSDEVTTEVKPKDEASQGWEHVLQQFEGKMITVDVRELEMPQPMMTILGALDQLPDDNALFVYHKRIPVFLLPELSDRNLDYRIKEISDGEVNLLIFKN